MNIYTILFIFGFIFSIFTIVFDKKIDEKYKKIIFYITIFLLIILSGFRSLDVGYDNEDHYKFFNMIKNNDITILEFKEPGFYILSFIVSLFGNYYLLLIVIAILSFVILIKGINHFSVYPYLSLYLYYCLYFLGNNMAKIRQSISMLFIILAFKYFSDNKKKKFIIFVLIASTFHASALILLIFLFLDKINLTSKKMFIFLIICIIIGKSGLVDFLYRDVIGNSEFISSIKFLGLGRLAKYVDSIHTVRQSSGYVGYLFVLMNSIFTILFYNKYKDKLEKKEILISKIYYFGSLIFFLLFNLAMINSRLTMGFLIFQIFLIPLFIKYTKAKNFKLIVSLFLIFLFLLSGCFKFFDNFEYYVPFKFFWQ